MILVVDIGNTNIVFGLYLNNTLLHKWRINSDSQKTANDYAIDIIELCLNHHIDCLQINGSIISSVVPSLTQKIQEAIKKLGNLQLKTFLLSDLLPKLDIDIQLHNKTEVGQDRLVNAIAGYHKFGGNLIIIDFGTATTFDVVGKNGQYLGGIIACGVNVAIKALHENTAQLPKINIKPQKRVIGKNTFEAINSGSYFGNIALVTGLVKQLEQELNIATVKILTGGMAEIFKDSWPNIINHYQPNLTLEGLKIIFDKQ
jgi:type III pantothenate kinase